MVIILHKRRNPYKYNIGFFFVYYVNKICFQILSEYITGNTFNIMSIRKYMSST